MIHPIAPRRALRLPLLAQCLIATQVIALVLAAALILTGRAEQAIQTSAALIAQAREQRIAVLEVLSALKDAETGQRGFLLTQRESYLAPYVGGQARVDAALGRLAASSEGSDGLPEQVAQLRDIAGQKLAELRRTVDLDRAAGPAAAMQLVLSDEGRATMDQARALVARIVTATDALRARQLDLFYARQREASRGVTLAAILGAVLLGGAVLVLLVNRDRTLRSREALRLQTARLGGAVEHMRDGVAVFDGDGVLLLANEHLLANAGWPPELLREGARFADFAAAAAHWPGAPLSVPRPAAGFSNTTVRVDERMLEVWRSPMPDGGQMLTVADISRREATEAVARQAQKMESLGQLTGGVAHDFNNLLQVMSANLELIGARIGDDPWLQARLSAALSGVERAARLTRHLLAFARRQPLAPESVDTRALLGGMEELLRRTLGEQIQVEMVLSGGLWPVRADPQQLENALLNLALNARDAMAGGGKLTIEAANAALDDDYAAAHADVTPGQYVVLAVTDTGIGMTEEQLGRAIEPFYTTKTNGRGTGLGLSMVYGFAKQSGGHFKLYSEPGHGTTARLYVPRSRAVPRATVMPPEADPAEGELVLVVEDDTTVRAASVQAVRGLGYRVIEANGAGAALALMEGGAKPDLLFTDVVMPGLPSARAMAERARALLPRLAVVFTSGYTHNAIVHNGKLDDGVILVSKPWRTAELARKLRQALAIATEQPAATPRGMRVLLVEDEMLVRMTTADMLADLGHEVFEASSGAQALERLELGVDLVLSDIGLPDMDGLALIAELRRRQPGLRVVVCSGREVAPSEEYGVLDKPYDQASLRAALERAAGQGGASR